MPAKRHSKSFDNLEDQSAIKNEQNKNKIMMNDLKNKMNNKLGPKKMVKHILAESIERFEEEKQPHDPSVNKNH